MLRISIVVAGVAVLLASSALAREQGPLKATSVNGTSVSDGTSAVSDLRISQANSRMFFDAALFGPFTKFSFDAEYQGYPIKAQGD
jgi:hypothetical protein